MKLQRSKKLIIPVMLALAVLACTLPVQIGPLHRVTPQPTLPPTAVTSPTPLPTTVQEIAWNSQTACDHPYFPVRPGSTWTYSDQDENTVTWTVTSVGGDTSSAQAVMAGHSGVAGVGYDITCNLSCTPDGIFGDRCGMMPFVNLPGWEYKGFLHKEGVFLPASPHLYYGSSWQLVFELYYTMEFEGIGSIPMTISQSENYNLLYGDLVPIDAPSGHYDTIEIIMRSDTLTQHPPIEVPGVGSQQTDIQEESPPEEEVTGVHSSGTGRYYLALGVGIVEILSSSISDSGGQINNQVSLLSYTIP